MGKHILFLVHGMGVHKNDDWANEVTQKIKEVANQYSGFEDKSISDLVEFVPINYDFIFNDLLKKWKDDSEEVRGLDIDDALDLDNFLGWLDDAGADEKNFFWSHIADVIIYRFFPLYRQRIRTEVINQIAQKIDDTIDNYGKADCSILAHSLGCAVAHDSIHYLGTTGWTENGNNVLGPTSFRFKSFMMFANTSRLLQSDVKAYESICRSGPNLDPNSYAYVYWNIYHEFDPVPYPRKFEPVGWDAPYLDINVRHFRKANIHALTHYLDHPRIHIPFIRFLTQNNLIQENEQIQAIDEYNNLNIPGMQDQDIKNLKLELEDLKHLLESKDEISDIVKQLVKYYKIVDQYI